MSFGKKSRLFQTLAFRLTFWHATVFSFASLTAFLVFYAIVSASTQSRTDALMLDKAQECSSILASEGLSGIENEVKNESEAYGTHDIFLRLISNEGKVLASSDEHAWKSLPKDTIGVGGFKGNSPFFTTLMLQGHHSAVRTMSYPIGPDAILQIALSMKENEHLMRSFRIVFSSALILVTSIAVLLGGIMSKRAMAKVETVTQTALMISNGTLETRVPLSGGGDEIDRLAEAFNGMLGRIETLVAETKETNDNIAHELRTPVTRIRGFAETTLSNRGSIAEHEAVSANTIEECDRLLSLINTMLEIGQAEAGVSNLQIQEIDCVKLLEDAHELFLPVAEDKGVALILSVPAALQLKADVKKLQRAVANLIDNAIKYSPPGGRIFVTLEEKLVDIEISVRDQGIGIQLNDLPRIFERFYRSDRSRAEVGNGLGLSLARALVRAHGGDITAQSEMGSGSLFTIKLPRITGTI